MAALVCNMLSIIISVGLFIVVGTTMLVLGLTGSLQDDDDDENCYDRFYDYHGEAYDYWYTVCS